VGTPTSLRGRGGVLIAPSSSIGPEVSAESIAAMYRRVRERNAEVGRTI